MDTIQVVYNSAGEVLIVLGEQGVSLSRDEAEALFIDLGHCLKDMDVVFDQTTNSENED